MKYKLINSKTKKEYICEKVTIDGFDYYVSDEQATEGFYGYINFNSGDIKKVGKHFSDDWRKVIATSNPNIDIPKVVDEVEEIIDVFLIERGEHKTRVRNPVYSEERELAKKCYNKSQETHSFSEEDMVEFDKWKNEKYKLLHGEYVDTNDYYSIPDLKSVKKYTTKELLEIWEKQKIKTIYYE